MFSLNWPFLDLLPCQNPSKYDQRTHNFKLRCRHLLIIYMQEGKCKNKRSSWACPRSGQSSPSPAWTPTAPVCRTHAEGAWQSKHDVQGLCPRTSFLHGWEGYCISREFLFLYLCSGILCDTGKIWRGVACAEVVMNLWQGKVESTQISGEFSYLCLSKHDPWWHKVHGHWSL